MFRKRPEKPVVSTLPITQSRIIGPKVPDEELAFRVNAPSWLAFHCGPTGDYGLDNLCENLSPRRLQVNVDKDLEDMFKSFRTTTYAASGKWMTSVATLTHFSLWTQRTGGLFIASGKLNSAVNLCRGDTVTMDNNVPHYFA